MTLDSTSGDFPAESLDDQSNTDPGYWCCAGNDRWLRQAADLVTQLRNLRPPERITQNCPANDNSLHSEPRCQSLCVEGSMDLGVVIEVNENVEMFGPSFGMRNCFGIARLFARAP
jgi:hypothetical protein